MILYTFVMGVMLQYMLYLLATAPIERNAYAYDSSATTTY